MSLNTSLLRDPPPQIDTDAVIAAVFEDQGLSPAARALDEACGGRISALLRSGDVSGKAGRCTLLLALDGIRARRVLDLAARTSQPAQDGFLRILPASAQATLQLLA